MTIGFEQAIAGAQVPISVPTYERCPTCAGTGAKPGTSPIVCPRCNGRGVEIEGQGLFSISTPCSRCGGAGTIIEEPVPDLPGRGAPAHRQALPREHPRRRARGQQDPPRRQGRARPQRRPPRRPLRHHARAGVAGLRAQGRQRRGRGPAHAARGAARRRDRGPDARRPQDAARPRRHASGQHPAPARRGPQAPRQAGPGRHPLPLRAGHARHADGRAGGSGGRSGEGLQRQPPQGAVPT